MTCVFCGADGKMSREHVFRVGLRSCSRTSARSTISGGWSRFSTDEHHQRPGPAFDVVVRDVCRDCNHSWMERLESQARPILTPMLLDEPRVITAVEQHIVATWVTKTMLTMQGANIGGERVVSVDRYRWFCEKQTPLSGSHIWLCRYSDRTRWPLSTHQRGMTALPEGEGTPQIGDPMNGFGVAYAIGPLVFRLFGVDLPGNPQTSAGSDDGHLLIWPAVGPDIRWPPRETITREADLEALARRMPDGTLIHGMPTVAPLTGFNS